MSTFKRVGLFHNNAHTFKLAKYSESHTTMFYKLGPCDSFFLFSEFLINPNIHFAHPSKRSLRKSTYRDVAQKLIQSFSPLHCWNIADTVYNKRNSIKQTNEHSINLRVFKSFFVQKPVLWIQVTQHSTSDRFR